MRIATASIGFTLTLLAGAIAANGAEPRAGTFKVLFIGNSHLFINNVPARVGRRLQSVKGRIKIRTITQGGVGLTAFTGRPDVVSALTRIRWHVVVLQEATATFASPNGGRRFHASIDWFEQHVPPGTRIVLFQTWPWLDTSRYFARRRSNAARQWHAMQRAYAKVASNSRITVAPVGPCWVRSPVRLSYYSADGNHATVEGSNLAAEVIARTILSGRPGSC